MDTILIADDNPGVRRVLVQMLGAAGMRTVTAGDGDAALEAARRLRPDLIILDVRMPGRDGLSVCGALREDEATRRIPVMILTGMGESAAQYAGIGSGADDYMGKPFHYPELERRVRGLLARKA